MPPEQQIVNPYIVTYTIPQNVQTATMTPLNLVPPAPMPTASPQPAAPAATPWYAVTETQIPQNYTGYLGGGEPPDNISFSLLFNGRLANASVNLNKASFCCAVAELGALHLRNQKESDDFLIKAAMRKARDWNKAQVRATVTDGWKVMYEISYQVLLDNGFVLTKRFRNRNTGKIINELEWTDPSCIQELYG